jgi:hypothetical protein
VWRAFIDPHLDIRDEVVRGLAPEIVAPGQPICPGAVYDSNAAILAAANAGYDWT